MKIGICYLFLLFGILTTSEQAIADNRIVKISCTSFIDFVIHYPDGDVNLTMKPESDNSVYSVGTFLASGTAIGKDIVVTNLHVLDVNEAIWGVANWLGTKNFDNYHHWTMSAVRVRVKMEIEGRKTQPWCEIVFNFNWKDKEAGEKIKAEYHSHGLKEIRESENHDLAFIFLEPEYSLLSYFQLDMSKSQRHQLPVTGIAYDHVREKEFRESGIYKKNFGANPDRGLEDPTLMEFSLHAKAGCSGGAIVNAGQELIAIITKIEVDLNDKYRIFGKNTYGIPAYVVGEELKITEKK